VLLMVDDPSIREVFPLPLDQRGEGLMTERLPKSRPRDGRRCI
jgi:hypothetical protein